MSSVYDDILKQGYLRVKSKGFKSWNKRWFILRKSSSNGPARLERYLDEETSFTRDSQRKIILLKDATSVSLIPPENRKNSFAIILADGSSKQFIAESTHELTTWLQECQHQFERSKRNGDIALARRRKDVYNVYLLPSNGLSNFGECLLEVTPELINIWDPDRPDKLIVCWPITSLRRYGKDTDNFTIEAGRRCDTGEGLFVFTTYECSEIYDEVHKASQSIAAAQRIISTENFMNNNNTPISRTKSEPTHAVAPSFLDNAALVPSAHPFLGQPQRNMSLGESEASYRELPPAPLPPTRPPPLPFRSATYQATLGPPSPENLLSMRGGPLSQADRQASQEPQIYEERQLTEDFKKFHNARRDNGL